MSDPLMEKMRGLPEFEFADGYEFEVLRGKVCLVMDEKDPSKN